MLYCFLSKLVSPPPSLSPPLSPPSSLSLQCSPTSLAHLRGGGCRLVPFPAEKDGGKGELGATSFSPQQFGNHRLSRRSAFLFVLSPPLFLFFMGRKRLEMTRRVNLLHKVSALVSPPKIPLQTRIYSCLNASLPQRRGWWWLWVGGGWWLYNS